jgi:hypothetical protein
VEFLKIIDLPQYVRWSLELALSCGDAEAICTLERHDWRVVDAFTLSQRISPYREYILGSCGEFTVAKDQNVRLRSGWFSDRSACYLAAGKPVITQDTAFGNVLPAGAGLFAFRTVEDIVAACDVIDANYAAQSRAAHAVGEQYFKAETVLRGMLDRAGA